MRRNLVLLVIVSVLVLVAAEGVLRVNAGRERARMRESIGERALCTEASPDARLVYTYRAGECGANARGFRDREHAAEKPAGTVRILVIGDSVAEGRDVPADSTFPRLLERTLDARGDGRDYEVILLARIGYSTSQELVLLEDEAPRYHPDLIVWSYCLNDPAHPVYHNANGDLGRYYAAPRSQLVALARAAAFRVAQKRRGRACPGEFHAFVHCAFAHEIERHITRIGETSARSGVPVVFTIHPVFPDAPDFRAYTLRDVHARLADSARRAGLSVVDVLDEFAPYAPAELKIHNPAYFDPWHLNERGHRVTADALARAVVAHRP